MPHRLCIPINQAECDATAETSMQRDASYPAMNDFRMQSQRSNYATGGSVNSMNSSHTGAIYETAGSSVTSAGPQNGTFDVPPNHSDTNLFFRFLPLNLTDADLKAMFEPFGTVISAAVMRDIYTGESLGTAFVRFDRHDAALAAMQHYANHTLGGTRGLVVQWAKKQHDSAVVGEARKKRMKLFVRNVPLDITEDVLAELMSHYGRVECVTLHADTVTASVQSVHGRHAGMALQQQQQQVARHIVLPEDRRLIAFVTFSQEGAAAAACDAVHNTCPFPSCRGIPIMAKLADPNRQRANHAQYPLHHNHKQQGQYPMQQSNSSTPTSRASSAASSGGHRTRGGGVNAPAMRPYLGQAPPGSPSLSTTSNPMTRVPHFTQVPSAMMTDATPGSCEVNCCTVSAPMSPPMYMSPAGPYDPAFSTTSSFNHSTSNMPASLSHGSYVDATRLERAEGYDMASAMPQMGPNGAAPGILARYHAAEERRRGLGAGNASLSGGEDTMPPYCATTNTTHLTPLSAQTTQPPQTTMLTPADCCYAAQDESWPQKPSADEVMARRTPCHGLNGNETAAALATPMRAEDGSPYTPSQQYSSQGREIDSAPLSLVQLDNAAAARHTGHEAGKSWGSCSTRSTSSSTMRYRHNPYNPVDAHEMVQ